MSSRRAAVCLAVAARRCPAVARAAAQCTGCSHRTGCRGTRHRDLVSQRAQRSSSCSAPHVDRVSQSCRTAAAERCRASLPAVRAAPAAVHLMKYHAEQRRQQRWVLMPRTPAAAPLPPEPHPPQQRQRRVPGPAASQAATSRGLVASVVTGCGGVDVTHSCQPASTVSVAGWLMSSRGSAAVSWWPAPVPCAARAHHAARV